jgi:hypothetical protein
MCSSTRTSSRFLVSRITSALFAADARCTAGKMDMDLLRRIKGLLRAWTNSQKAIVRQP